MKTEKELGAILIRLLSDEVTMQEVRLVLTQLRDRPELRERASSIGMLADESAEIRGLHCKHMLEILVNQVIPNTYSNEGDRLVYPASVEEFYGGTARLLHDLLQPLPSYSTWFGHVYREGTAIGKFHRNKSTMASQAQYEYCIISEELWSIVTALEDLWGMQGDYALRGSVESFYLPREDFLQKRELKKRGAKGVL